MCCPDCKDGFYYPLIGPPENCQTCNLPELGEKPQAEDRMHQKTISERELSDMEVGSLNPYSSQSEYLAKTVESKRLPSEIIRKEAVPAQFIHGVTYVSLPDIAEVVRNKRTIMQAAIDHHKVKIDEEVLKEIERRNLNIQGTEIGRMFQSVNGIYTKPMEYAKQLLHMLKMNPGMSETDLAEKISKPVTFVRRYLDLLDLDPEIQQLVDDGTLAIQTVLTGEPASTDWSEYIPKSLSESQMRHMGLVFKEYPTTLVKGDTPKSMIRVIMKSFLEHTPITEIATILMKAEGTISIHEITKLANNAINKREARCEANRGQP